MGKHVDPKTIVKSLVACTLAALLALFPATGCTSANSGSQAGSSAEQSTQASQENTLTTKVTKHDEYENAVTELSAKDFTQAGFEFGDSFDVVFSSGYTLTDVPYYNGYYVKRGMPVIVAYSNESRVNIARNCSELWSVSGLGDSGTATITLNTRGKYLSEYKMLAQHYSTDRADYSSDVQFANFRALSGGKLKKNFLYRGASPVDNSRGRAAIANSIIKKHKIADVIDLSDSDSKMQEHFSSSEFSSDYARKLYESGKTVALGMDPNYESDDYKASVATGMRHLMKNDGPAYIHCIEGKDRTGFVCFILEALAGASYDEMRDDYMITYKNYYGITKKGTPKRYNAVVSVYFDGFASYMNELTTGTAAEDVSAEQLKTTDYKQGAKSYLSACGLSDDEISQLKDLITK